MRDQRLLRATSSEGVFIRLKSRVLTISTASFGRISRMQPAGKWACFVRDAISSELAPSTVTTSYTGACSTATAIETKGRRLPAHHFGARPKLVETLEAGYLQLFFERDGDGLWFINPFAIGVTPPNAAALAEDGSVRLKSRLKKLGEVIELEPRLTDVGQLATMELA